MIARIKVITHPLLRVNPFVCVCREFFRSTLSSFQVHDTALLALVTRL